MTDGRDAARKYLEHQRAMGPEHLILPVRRPQRMPPPPPPPEPSSVSAPAAPTSMPPSGIQVDLPASDLFRADPVQDCQSIAEVADLVAGCTKCPLCEGRTHTVPGEGDPGARLIVIGEGPGRTEDETGRPFVGQAGELLTKILAAIDLPRDRVFIGNVVKCRPPNNRTPADEEIKACLPYLYRQIELIQPKVILAMGGTAATTLLRTKASLGKLRHAVHRFGEIPLIVTYHPAALLRNPNWKRPTWDDVRLVRKLLDV